MTSSFSSDLVRLSADLRSLRINLCCTQNSQLAPCGVLQKLCGQRGESDHCGLEYVGGRCFMIGNHDVDDSFLATTEPGAVSRLVIIDGPNVLHGYRSLTGNEDRKLDAVHLLSLVRFFVSRGIECMVVTLHKYMLESVTENTFIMREQGLLMVMDKTYDDLMLFAVAGEFDGVILSEDQFKSRRSTRAQPPISSRRASGEGSRG
ncbi:hypothetical protein PMAYCL1PPCAC_10408, partial [Pristionchus mayeri]